MSDFFSIETYLVVLIFNLLTKSFSANRCWINLLTEGFGKTGLNLFISFNVSNGIFSNSYDLAKYAQLFLNGGIWLGNRVLSYDKIQEFSTRQELPPGSDRALGWDTPSRNGRSSAGDYFSEHSYGHLGFTGTSLWIDQEKNIIIVLLTNRVHPTRKNGGMYTIRRKFHTEIMKAIL